MKFKKILMALAMLIIASSCSKNANKTDSEAKKQGDEKKIVTVTTSFLYDMVDNLVGDKVDRELIIPAGEDPHLYTAKPQDLEKIKKADLLLYHGLHFEGKMVDVLEKRGSAVARSFKKEDVGEMEQDGKVVVDPHFWFNINLYKEATRNAAEDLEKLLPEEKENIEKNLKDYLAKLDDLDKENKEKINSIPESSRFLITPHDAFNYFSRAYNIPVKAPQGVSTDSEVANKDIEDTVNFIVKNKIKAIFAESTTDPMRMEKLKEAVNAKGFDVEVVSGQGKELFSDSLAPEGQAGDSYIDMYKHNVDLIVENLK
ncbi:metal ABC transporter solute-binding protein, Zn/Mn family [Anaerococcus sp. Marseille-P3625]|uniref:metal ABC transporter solute-binding protein, Zn/Mn family n=1 Tax=Anaerococcus sp. Marseille-P3625 TaxID=1977277 RepID=UPI000C06CCF4|nr:zinc ABC transporter substrate-binding protein [Anaerococcus sp. Marseille-P3625]